MKRATEKRGNSASVWEFSCTRESLECALHSAEIFRVNQSFKDGTREKMGSLGTPVRDPAGNRWPSHVGSSEEGLAKGLFT